MPDDATLVGSRTSMEAQNDSKDDKEANEQQNGDLEAGQVKEKATPAPAPLTFEAGDKDDPHNWPAWRKRIYVVILGFATFTLVFNSSGYTSSIPEIQAYFGISFTAAVLGVAVYVFAFGAGPLFWGPLSEMFGRRPVYILTFIGYTAFALGVAFAQNTGTLLSLRFLMALFGSTALNNAPASIFDFADLVERSRYSAIYGTSVFFGPALGPLLSGFIAVRAGMRWNLRFEAILAGTSLLLLLLVPETHGPTLLRKKALRSGNEANLPPRPALLPRLRKALLLPFVCLFTEPITMAVAGYMSLLYGILYGFFAGIPIAFEIVRGFSRESTALIYISMVLGCLAGFFVLYVVVPWDINRVIERKKTTGEVWQPEDRLRITALVAPLLPISLFIFAFTAYPNVNWFGECVGLFLFVLVLVPAFVTLIPFMIDTYRVYAASALAATSLARALFGGALPLFVTPMFERLSVTGAVGLLAGLTTLMTIIPFALIKYGPRLRKASHYASA